MLEAFPPSAQSAGEAKGYRENETEGSLLGGHRREAWREKG